MVKYIFDTDIGDDIDDALALATVLNSDKMEICGITTVHGEVEIRSRLAGKIVQMFDKNIPVVTGIAHPLNQPPRTGVVQAQAKVLEESDEFPFIESTKVTDFIRNICASYPRSMKIMCLGPLTNIAQTLIEYPEVSGSINEIIMMGGSIAKGIPEYNIFSDPEAAEVIFKSDIPTRIMPSDITEKCIMNDSMLNRLFSANKSPQKLLADLIKYWQEFNHTTYPILHDPLTIGCLITPELYEFERVDIEVVLEPGERRGVTVGVPNHKSAKKICTSVNYEGFFKLFESLIMKDYAAVVKRQ